MKERKTHYRPSRVKDYLQCGAVIKRNTKSTVWLDEITCRVCMFSYLAEQAPWAREFLDELRGALVVAKRSAGKTLQGGFRSEEMESRVMIVCPGCPACPHQPEVEAGHVLRRNPIRFEGSSQSLGSVATPATLPEQVNGKEECLGRSLGTLLSQQGTSEKLIREFLPVPAPAGGSVEPVMDNSGPAAEPVGVQPRKVAEYARDAGKIGDEPGWDF